MKFQILISDFRFEILNRVWNFVLGALYLDITVPNSEFAADVKVQSTKFKVQIVYSRKEFLAATQSYTGMGRSMQARTMLASCQGNE